MNLSDPESKRQFVFIFRICLCILCWTAIGIRMWLNWVLVAEGGSPIEVFGNAFSFYTTQTNLIVAGWITLSLIFYKKEDTPAILHPSVHGAITGYISVTWIVFALLLSASYQPTGIEAFTNISMHYIIPIAFIIDWFISESNVEYQYSWVVYWLIYPFLYLAYTVIRGAITGFYPYFFVDLNEITVYALILNVVVLTIFFTLLGAVIIFLNRRIYTKSKK